MTTEVAKKETAGAVAVTGSRGFEDGVGREDLIIPRAKLLQALSPEVAEDPRKFTQGMIINSLTKEELPDVFVPVFVYFEWIKFNPRSSSEEGFDTNFEPGAIVWRTNDPNDPRVANDPGSWQYKIMNFFSIFPGVPMPVITSFSKSSYKAGKNLISLAKFGGGDMFSKKYRLTSKLEKNDKGQFYILRTDPAGLSSEDERKQAEGLWNEFRRKASELEVHTETETVPF